jgi:hypothetical protein
MDLSLYLIRAYELQVVPNFFMSLPSLELYDVKVKLDNDWVWLEENHKCILPPLPIKSGFTMDTYPKIDSVWACFEKGNWRMPTNHQQTFLDYQYIFDMNNFQDLSGGKWESFRKNIRKWPKNNSGYSYSRIKPSAKKAGKLIGCWLEDHEKDVQDAVHLSEFVYFYNNSQIHRKFLYNKYNELVGINAWDENYFYINYRYCIIKDIPYLDEFMRWLFYTDDDVFKCDKLINDGGCLDSPGLEKFKDKLNPIRKVPIYTWTKI